MDIITPTQKKKLALNTYLKMHKTISMHSLVKTQRAGTLKSKVANQGKR